MGQRKPIKWRTEGDQTWGTTHKGRMFVIDTEDLHLFSDNAVCMQRDYFSANVEGKTRAISRVVMCTPPGLYTDHINRKKWDNRKANLRICTPGESMQNVGKRKTNRAGYLGVSWSGRGNKYKAAITKDRKQYSLGTFTDPKEASEAYEKAKKLLHSVTQIGHKCPE